MITLSIVVCLAAFFWLLWLLRRSRLSLGLPVAYLYSLLLIHVPGAFAHLVGRDFFINTDLIEIAMRSTALGSVCFVAGVWLARSSPVQVPFSRDADRPLFWRFCLLGGWILIYCLRPFLRFPSVGAAIDAGGAIWMLGVLFGLREACARRDSRWIGIWITSLMVFPSLMLLLGGFMSYGATAIIIVISVLTISTKSYARVVIGVAIFTFLSLSIFVVYFQHRDDIRRQVWGGAPINVRIDSIANTVKDFQWFDPSNRAHLIALDHRLNQNFFVGLAAVRIEYGQAKYLYGESVWEGLLALVPRALWPNKPVFAGSPEIVSKMTGLLLSPTSSFGVGNVMEFQINFGTPGVVIGFLLLGWALAKLDFKAAIAEAQGHLGKLALFFLCSVALIKPNGSIVELSSGSAAAVVAALFWDFAWKRFSARKPRVLGSAARTSVKYSESSAYSHQPLA